MITPQTQDATTRAKIVIIEPDSNALTGTFIPPNSISTSNLYEFIDTVGFTYSSDPTVVGDPFTVAIPNPNGDYTGTLTVGTRVQLFLENPNVKKGDSTHKQTGIIVRRRVQSSVQGTVIYLECADLGWHLLNNDAPLWSNLTSEVPISQLLKKKGWIDPSWGIMYDPEFDNLTNRNIKINNARLGKVLRLSPSVEEPLPRIQVEPGDKIADILIAYARRQNAFMNVNIEGHIQFWNPDYSQKPLYRFEYHPPGTARGSLNNVLDASLEEDLTTQWSQVTCVGEMLITKVLDRDNIKGLNINATKVRGTFIEQPSKIGLTSSSPFVHRAVFSDGEIYESDQALRLARWRYERGKYDAWKLNYVVKDHWQMGPNGGTWYEADTMCEVNDEINGVSGLHYISAVTYTRNEQGDQTQITLRKPGFLTAYFNAPTPTKTRNKKKVLLKASPEKKK